MEMFDKTERQPITEDAKLSSQTLLSNDSEGTDDKCDDWSVDDVMNIVGIGRWTMTAFASATACE